MTRQQVPLPVHLSNSQVKTLLDCGERYRLERQYRVPEAPSFAAVGGKTLHTATELFDLRRLGGDLTTQYLAGLRSDQEDIPASALHRVAGLLAGLDDSDLGLDMFPRGKKIDPTLIPEWVNKACWDLFTAAVFLTQTQTDHPMARFRVFGKPSKANPYREGFGWWLTNLPVFLVRYMVWVRDSGFTLAMLNNVQPAIEVNVKSKVGNVALEGYIDRIWLDRSGNPVVGDIKSNGQEPGSSEQLGLYSVLLETLGFPKPQLGYFWMARTGEVGSPRDLSPYDLDYFVYKYGAVIESRNRGVFFPNPDSTLCGGCAVKDWCYIKGGTNAVHIPRPWLAAKPTFKEYDRR